MEISTVVRSKLSVTVKKELVQWIDNLIQRGLFRNRSHVVEEALKHIKKVGIRHILLEKLEEK